jgi:hypothetical protein
MRQRIATIQHSATVVDLQELLFQKIRCERCGKTLLEVSWDMRGVIRKKCSGCKHQNIVVR